MMKATICALLVCLCLVARSQENPRSPHLKDPEGEGCLVLFDLINPKDQDWGSQMGLECVPDLVLYRRCRVPLGSSFLVDTNRCALGSTLGIVDVAGGAPGEFPTVTPAGDMPAEGVEFRCTETGIQATFAGTFLKQVELVDCYNYPESVEDVPLDLEALGYTTSLFNPKDLGHCFVLADTEDPQDKDFAAFFDLTCSPNLASAPVCKVPLDTKGSLINYVTLAGRLSLLITVTRDFCNATFTTYDVEVLTVDGVSARTVGTVSGPIPEGGVELTCTETGLAADFPPGYPKERVELVQCGNYPGMDPIVNRQAGTPPL